MRERIQALDGLRFLAALGVLWIHAWSGCGNARFYIANIDISSLLAIGGNGVDLFLVISGFWMYYFYVDKLSFNFKDIDNFLKKRWLRLSPAFYVATIVYLLLTKNEIQLPALLTSLFYLNSILQQYNISSHFWTLGVEWQFYCIIPIILIGQRLIGFGKIFISTFTPLAISSVIAVLLLKEKSDILTAQLVFRGIEFAFGILVAYLLINRPVKLRFRFLFLLLSIITTYAGRVFLSKPVLVLSPDYYNLFKLSGFTLMGIGFAGIIYLALTSNGWLKSILSNKFFKSMGKISYSFYLWHGLVLIIVSEYLPLIIPHQSGIIMPILITIISTMILYPISRLSYVCLEKPFLSESTLTSK